MLRRLRRSLTTRLVIQISSTVLAIYLIVFSYNYVESRKQITQYAKMHCRRVAESTANLIESMLDEAEHAAEDSVPVLLQNWNDRAFLKTLIEMIISQNLQLEGAVLIINSPGLNDDSIIHINRTPRGLRQAIISDEVLYSNSEYQKLYLKTKEQGRASWSVPTIEPVADTPVMLFCVPIFKDSENKQSFKGAFIIEVDLLKIEEITTSVKVFNTGFSFIITDNGTLFSYPIKNFIARETIFDLARQYNKPSLADVGKHMISNESGFSIIDSIILKKESYIYYVPIMEYRLSLAVLCAKDDMFSGMISLSKQLIAMACTGFVILFILVAYIAGKITKPLRNLSYAAYSIGKGNLDFDIPRAKSHDEVGVLTNVFSEMRESLKNHISMLTKTTAVKERIEKELQIAHEVQMSILPEISSIPANPELSLHAMIAPAKEVGGDMYDFFMADEATLWLVIGDVSGKGVPAAFYMALAKTMLHVTALSDSMPGDVLSRVNNEICKNNPYMMFITVFIAKLNIRTGILHYSNAGHIPPAILSSNSNPSYLNEKIGPACGLQHGFKYGSRRAKLFTGETLFMFTDGVTESINPGDELYGDDRLDNTLSHLSSSAPEELINKIADSIMDFSGDAPQYDDITMLAARYNGVDSHQANIKKSHIYLENILDNVDRVHGFISDFCKSAQIDAKISSDLQLILEEVFINVCNYAFNDRASHYIYISMSFDGKEITWSVEDDGKPFNPLKFQSAQAPASIEEMKIGGQGIRLVKKLCDSLDYEYVNGKNILIGKKGVT
jgi:sigma-B regulation protein RsbU (phosphoserine phosphatase)